MGRLFARTGRDLRRSLRTARAHLDRLTGGPLLSQRTRGNPQVPNRGDDLVALEMIRWQAAQVAPDSVTSTRRLRTR
jgi:hypothetical protein